MARGPNPVCGARAQLTTRMLLLVSCSAQSVLEEAPHTQHQPGCPGSPKRPRCSTHSPPVLSTVDSQILKPKFYFQPLCTLGRGKQARN